MESSQAAQRATPSDSRPEFASRHLVVDSVRTHYLEAGDGPVVVLLHSGEFGASAELSWERNISALAQDYRVIAPDWLGFGGTDKLFDFGGGAGRRITHLARFLEMMAIDRAAFVGSSMGGNLLVREVAKTHPVLPAAAMVLSSSGGATPDNDARRCLIDYDGTPSGMQAILRVLFHDRRWWDDDEYIARRHAASVEPGAWEAVAAARLKRPGLPPAAGVGGDDIPYEDIAIPSLLVAGAADPLREPGYAERIAPRIPVAEARSYEDCAHMPHIEHADRFNADVLEFLGRHYRNSLDVSTTSSRS